MQTFIDYFSQLSTLSKLLWVFISLSLFWIAEYVFPLFTNPYKKIKHASKNIILLLFTMLINLFLGFVSINAFNWAEQNNFGLLKITDLHWIAELLITVMWIDLIAQYTVHYFLHKVKWMWKFHMVHHSDTMVDATTGTRHHPGDYLIREILALSATIVIGAPFAFYMFYRMASVFFTYLTHANISLPLWMDKTMSYVFISPNTHKFHHHFERPWTDSNFGNIFSFWDRLFGTFVYQNPAQIKYGLDVLEDNKALDLKYQLKIPFDNSIETDY